MVGCVLDPMQSSVTNEVPEDVVSFYQWIPGSEVTMVTYSKLNVL